MARVLRDDPAVNPDIRAFLRNHVLEVKVCAGSLDFLLDIEHLAGVDDCERCLAADHLIANLVNHIGLHERLLGNQLVLDGLELGLVGRVDVVAEELLADHEGIADRVLHENVVLVLRVPEVGPAGRRLGFRHHRGVVEDADRAPAVGNRVLVLGVKALGLFEVLRVDVLVVRDLIEVDRLNEILLNHLLDDVVGGADHIVLDCARLNDREHLLVGLESVVDDLDAGLFLELLHDIFADVLAPVVDIERVVLLRGLLAAAAERKAECRENRRRERARQNASSCHSESPLCLF